MPFAYIFFKINYMAKAKDFQKDPSFNKSRGRRDSQPGKTSQDTKGRERNVRHTKSEEHSMKPKGNHG